MHALVVEDELVIALGLKAILQGMEFAEVTVVGTLNDLRNLGDIRVDLAIFDANLPDGCGREVAEEYAQRGVPTLIHSGHITRDQVSNNEHIRFLPKPSTRAEIKATIKSVLGTD
ncbi:response regulator [Shimia ponticola]|uniref:response regulator n=1 Tax=Shimia ponticola TaxID=2582893 RepID=UPI0011BE6E57|nr:response regulator [Shimia ponticola]